MKELPQKWIDYLLKQPESGMGYQIVTVTLREGQKFEAAVSGGAILGCGSRAPGVPFDPADITGIEVVPDWILRRNAHPWWQSQ
jgi:hypothetical protein